ncbi:MAG TPA: hypothetical protein VKQ36_09740 [Ktedonobacterales bacterium]|nr:hypothetical protein [Ktedonobacterales bacterium]
MRKYSYESVLGAVGRALDYAKARSFTVHEQEDSLLLEAMTGEEQQPLHVTLQLADLVEMVEWSAQADALPQASQSPRHEQTTGALHTLLARQHEREIKREAGREAVRAERRELVGAGR